jgi:hypothetical protein
VRVLGHGCASAVQQGEVGADPWHAGAAGSQLGRRGHVCMRPTEVSGHAGQLPGGHTRGRARRACAGAREKAPRARGAWAGWAWRMRAKAWTCRGGEGARGRHRDGAAARTRPAGGRGKRPPHAWRSPWRGRTGRGRAASMQVGGEEERRPHSPWPRHGDARPRTWRGAEASLDRREQPLVEVEEASTGADGGEIEVEARAHGRARSRRRLQQVHGAHGPTSRWERTDELDSEDEP